MTHPALVTGASGFIGRHLLRALLRENRKVFAICRNPIYLRDLEHPLLQVIPGDLENPPSYLPFLNSEVTVFHLAAARSFLAASPGLMNRINVRACLELGRASAQARVAKFIYVSTAFIFGPSQGRSVNETDGYYIQRMDNGYISSKAEAMVKMKMLIEHGLPLVTVCPTIVFGPDHPTYPNRITSHIRNLLRFGISLVIGGGHCKRNLVYVDDIVRGILLAESLDRLGEEYILGGEDLSYRELDRLVLSLAERKFQLSLSIPEEIALMAAKLTDRLRSHDHRGYEAITKILTSEWRYSSQKAQRVLGYRWTPIHDTILRTLEFVKYNEPNR